MLEWLKTILGDAYTDDIDKSVSQEIGKGFVARGDYNTLNSEKKALEGTVKDRDKQLETLKASSGDVEELKKQIETLQAENKTAAQAHEAEIKQVKINAAVENALTSAQAVNLTATKALLADFISKAELAEDGSVKGLAEQVKALTEAPDSSMLFKTSKPGGGFTGFKPPEGSGGAGGKDTKDMTYSELVAYLAENPDAKIE